MAFIAFLIRTGRSWRGRLPFRTEPFKAPVSENNPFGKPSTTLSTTTAIDCLAQAALQINSVCQSQENNFLQLGQQLQSIHHDAKGLVDMISRGLNGDDDRPIRQALQTMRRYADGAMEDQGVTLVKLRAEMSHVTAVTGSLNVLMQKDSAFSKIAKNLRTIGIHIAIESARTELAKTMLSSLAGEVKELSASVSQVAEQMHEDSASVSDSLGSVRSAMESEICNLQELVANARQTVEHALNKVQKLTAAMIDLMNAVGQSAKSIADQVAQVVMGIQIHDRITQRAQHITDFLEEIRKLLAGALAAGPAGLQLAGVYAKAHALLDLQVRQMDSVLADIDGVWEQGRAAFERLNEVVTGLAGQSCMLLQSNSRAGESGGPDDTHHETELKEALNHLLTLLDTTCKVVGRLTAIRGKTTRTIDQLNHHIERVRRVNFNIHLKALNAIVKSTRLGEQGRGLEVLVQEMKEQSNQSNVLVQEVADILEGLSLADDLLSQGSGGSSDGGEKAMGQLRQGIMQFTTDNARFMQQAKETLVLSGRLKDQITRAQLGMGFFEQFKSELMAQRDVIKALAGDLEPFAEAGSRQMPCYDLGIADHYTMQKERDIHNQAIEGARPSRERGSIDKSTSAVAVKNGEDLDDNVELF